MKSIIAIFLITLISPIVDARVPPDKARRAALSVMTSFVYNNRDVLRNIRVIDYTRKIVYFRDCRAFFDYKIIKRPKGVHGGSEPLELKRVVCKRGKWHPGKNTGHDRFR